MDGDEDSGETTAAHLTECLGLSGSVRSFVPGFSEATEPTPAELN